MSAALMLFGGMLIGLLHGILIGGSAGMAWASEQARVRRLHLRGEHWYRVFFERGRQLRHLSSRLGRYRRRYARMHRLLKAQREVGSANLLTWPPRVKP